MNVTDMMNVLSLRLEDASNTTFPEAAKLKALNNAQNRLVHQLHNGYLTELQVLQTSLTATSGEYAMSSLNFDVLKGDQGILKVKINGDLYCTRIGIQQLKTQENQYYKGSVKNPVYWVFKSTIYVSNGQTNPSIDVYYLKTPTPLIHKVDISAHSTPSTTAFLGDTAQNLSADDDQYNGAVIYSVNQGSYHVVTAYDAVGAVPGTDDRAFTVDPAAAANFGDDEIWFVTKNFDSLSIAPTATSTAEYVETSELNESLHETVITLAESELWAMDAQYNRKAAAQEMAHMMIDALNARYVAPSGIGTVGDQIRQLL